MIIFTAMGVLWFWLTCFEIGYGIAWVADKGWFAVVAIFDVLVGIHDAERTAAIVMASMDAGGSDGRIPDEGKRG